MRIAHTVGLAALLLGTLAAQTSKTSPGNGKSSREYKLVLNETYLEIRNKYIYPARAGVLRFASEAIENIPTGYRARETYTITGPDTFVERFELADPGKDFEVYSETRFRRKK